MSAVARAAEQEHVYSVTELTRNVKGMLESAFQSVWVEGELSRPTYHRSGHFYATLKDEGAQIDLVMWKGQVGKLAFTMEEGKQYLCFGNVSVYEKRGNYQLVLRKVEPAGLGALQLQFEQLKAQLEKEGLFDERHKQPLPAFPQRIGIVSSEHAAGLRDILTVLTRRFAGLEILVHHAAVQGKGAAKEIAHGIDVLDRLGNCDVLIVGRGGGSLEDLWAFNEEPVARAIFAAKTPIISAVGHEIDYTIADFVADHRAPTPSAAAELVVQERDAVVQRIADHRRRIGLAISAAVSALAQRLESVRGRYGFQRPRDLLVQHTQRVDDLAQALDRSIVRTAERAGQRLAGSRTQLRLLSPQAQVTRRTKQLEGAAGRLRALSPQRRVDAAAKDVHNLRTRLVHGAAAAVTRHRERFGPAVARLEALSPLRVLARGYSVTTDEQGAVLTEAAAVAVGDPVDVRLHRGRLHCRVEGTEENGHAEKGRT